MEELEEVTNKVFFDIEIGGKHMGMDLVARDGGGV